MSIEAMKQALEVLESAIDQLAKPYSTQAQYAITALRQAIEQAEKQEPVAVARVDDLERGGRVRALAMGLALDAPLYTTPPQREWVGLSQEERLYFLNEILNYGFDFVSPLDAVICAIETKLRSKNT
jgi:hypothetical protein